MQQLNTVYGTATMEAKFVMSPCGTRFPRTPENIAAFERGKGSNEKPEMKVEAVKVEDEVDADAWPVMG